MINNISYLLRIKYKSKHKHININHLIYSGLRSLSFRFELLRIEVSSNILFLNAGIKESIIFSVIEFF